MIIKFGNFMEEVSKLKNVRKVWKIINSKLKFYKLKFLLFANASKVSVEDFLKM